MTDRVFAIAGDWALASDGIQWMLMRRRSQRLGGWLPVSFVRSTKDILARCCREKGVDDDTAAQLLAGLPDSFDAWQAGQSAPQTPSGLRVAEKLVPKDTAEARRLYDGTRNTGLTVRPDPDWPGMWRIHYPDGTASDMVNISRATDAAQAWLSRTSPAGNARHAKWKNAHG